MNSARLPSAVAKETPEGMGRSCFGSGWRTGPPSTADTASAKRQATPPAALRPLPQSPNEHAEPAPSGSPTRIRRSRRRRWLMRHLFSPISAAARRSRSPSCCRSASAASSRLAAPCCRAGPAGWAPGPRRRPHRRFPTRARGEPAPGAAFVVGDGLRTLAGSPPPEAAAGLAGSHLGRCKKG